MIALFFMPSSLLDAPCHILLLVYFGDCEDKSGLSKYPNVPTSPEPLLSLLHLIQDAMQKNVESYVE